MRTLTFGGVHLGAEFRDVDDADVRREGLPEIAGAVVEEVGSDGPAAAAGFRAGDVVVTFDGERVRSARHLARLVEETPDGRQVPVTVMRAGERLDLAVSPSRPDDQRWFTFRDSVSSVVEIPRALEGVRAFPREFGAAVEAPLTTIFGPRVLGVSVTRLTDQLAEYFGAADGGVLISEVAADTAASRAGLRAGDVITRFDGHLVRSTTDLQRRIGQASGETEIEVVRDRRSETLRVNFGG
jgi:serine protease Do